MQREAKSGAEHAHALLKQKIENEEREGTALSV